MDLIKTIEDDEEVEILSEESDAEVEVRPCKHFAEQRFHVEINFSINRRRRSDKRRRLLRATSSLYHRHKNTTRTPGMT